MSIKILLMSAFIFTTTTSCASETATYFRVWQGYKKPTLSQNDFKSELPAFMNETRALYHDVLSNYFVAMPPMNKPDFIPDEFALVALRSEADYQQIRSTERGRQYSEAHWTVFNKETSKSAPYSIAAAAPLQHNHSYNLIPEPIDWSQGHTTFFIGLKKSNISSTDFLNWLATHTLEVAEKFKPYGLKAYIVIANDQYEVAYMNWVSKEARETAFATPEGQKVRADSALYMDRLMFQEAQKFNQAVEDDRFYNTAL